MEQEMQKQIIEMKLTQFYSIISSKLAIAIPSFYADQTEAFCWMKRHSCAYSL